MHDEEFVGEVSLDTRLGILTHTDSQYNYVWTSHLRTLELRYPLNPQTGFQPGEMVRFIQLKDGRGPQVVHDLVKEHDLKLEVLREPGKDGAISWKAKVNMVFAPPTNERLRKMKAIDENVKGLAYTEDFLEVISFLPLDVVPGLVYKGFVTRLPEAFIGAGKKLGSLFCVKHKKNSQFNDIVTDRKEIASLLEQCPFADEFSRDDYDDIGLPKTPTSSNAPRLTDNIAQNGVGVAVNDQPQHEYIYEEDFSLNYAERLHDIEEGAQDLGLIVRTSDEYAVIWSSKHDLVRIQLASGVNEQQWSLAAWVHYRCFQEQSQLLHGVRCNYTAYDITPARGGDCDRIVTTFATEHGKEVTMQCSIANPVAVNSQLFHAYDAFVHEIICPHDRGLKELLQNGQTVKVMCVFADDYVKHRWIAFAVEKPEDTYQKLDGLPSVIDAKVLPYFGRHNSRRVNQIDEQMHMLNVGARFKPPLGWTGAKQTGDRVVNVLGVAIRFERQKTVSVIATAFGLARQPKVLELGTWVEATIEAESDDRALHNHTYESFMHEHSYRVLYSKKISPPMSTRVLMVNGTERVLMCGDVKSILTGLQNTYLGRVKDTHGHLVSAKSGESYLVELGITRHPEDNRICYWNVLKSHGKSVINVHKVPLAMSHFTAEEGKTCDDAHRILIDPVFDAKENAFESAKPVNAYESMARSSQQREVSNAPLELSPTAAACSSSSSSSLPTRPKQQQQQWVELQQGMASSTAQQRLPPPSNSNTNVFTTANVDRLKSDALFATPKPSEPSAEKKPVKTMTSTTTNFDLLESDELFAELKRYQPSAEKKQPGTALVVRKRPEYLLMYNPKHGVCIVLPKYAGVQSAYEFDEKFALGEFYHCSFVRVADQAARGLTYEWMCKGDFRLSTSRMKTRLIMGGYVQVNVRCEFSLENLTKLNGDHWIIKTDIGHVRFSKDFLDSNDFLNKAVEIWVTYVKEIEKCHWQIVLETWNSLMDESEVRELEDDFVVVEHQQQQRELTQAEPKRPLHTQAEPEPPLHNKLYRYGGYADFLFGSEVPDGLGGESYRVQCMADDSEVGNSDTDSEYNTPIANWDDSDSTTDEEEFDDIGSVANIRSRADTDNAIPFDASKDFESRLRVIGGSSPPPRSSVIGGGSSRPPRSSTSDAKRRENSQMLLIDY